MIFWHLARSSGILINYCMFSLINVMDIQGKLQHRTLRDELKVSFPTWKEVDYSSIIKNPLQLEDCTIPCLDVNKWNAYCIWLEKRIVPHEPQAIQPGDASSTSGDKGKSDVD